MKSRTYFARAFMYVRFCDVLFLIRRICPHLVDIIAVSHGTLQICRYHHDTVLCPWIYLHRLFLLFVLSEFAVCTHVTLLVVWDG